MDTKEQVLEKFLGRNNLYLIRDFTAEDMIKDVIFSGRKCIVLWNDGTKTISQPSMYDDFDPEVGLAMAVVQKFFGSRNKFTKTVDNAMGKALSRKPTRKEIKFANNNAKNNIRNIIADAH